MNNTSPKKNLLSSTEKSAILLMSIGEDLAAELIRQLPKQDAQRILAVISRLGKVEDKVVDQVQQDFIALLATASKFKVGDKHFAKNILL